FGRPASVAVIVQSAIPSGYGATAGADFHRAGCTKYRVTTGVETTGVGLKEGPGHHVVAADKAADAGRGFGADIAGVHAHDPAKRPVELALELNVEGVVRVAGRPHLERLDLAGGDAVI